MVLFASFPVEVKLVSDYHHPVLLETLGLSFEETVSLVLCNRLAFCVAKSFQYLMRRSLRSLWLFGVHGYHAALASQSDIW